MAGSLVVVPCVVLAVMAWQTRWMADDGYIHLQVARLVTEGHGPVFNVGERIEASTSPLWVGMLVIASIVPQVAPPWEAVFLGIGLSVVGLAAAPQAGRLLSRRDRGWPDEGEDGEELRNLTVPLGAIVVACLPPFWEFATSGLETGLAFGWIGASSWWLAHRATTTARPSLPRELGGAVLVGLGPLVRPDLALFSLAFGAVVLAAVWPYGRRRCLAVLGAMAALPLLYQVFRMGYYAMLIPNTAVAKDASGARWSQGWVYVVDLAEPYWLWLPVALLVGILGVQSVGDRRPQDRLRMAARLAPATAGLVHALYVTRFGGDFMHARLLLPSLFALVAPVVVARPTRRDLPTLVTPAVVVWAVVAAVALRPDPYLSGLGSMSAGDTDRIEHERALVQTFFGLEHPVRIDLTERGPAPESGTARLLPEGRIFQVVVPLAPETGVDAVASSTVLGLSGYGSAADEYVLDVVGLAHPVAGHLDDLASERPGHQKYLPLAWQVAQFGAVEEVRAEDGEVLVTAAEVEAARRALDCGQLARYLDDVRQPMTPARFLGNIFDSVANTLFRVPSDPVEAERALCD